MPVILSILLAFLFVLTAPASTILVPGNYAKIQDAIAAAAMGDTVLVAPGSYLENLDFLGKEISVVSEQGPGWTMIDGNQAGTVALFARGEGSLARLEGFTLTNGSGMKRWTGYGYVCLGGGVYCDGASPTLVNNQVTSNILSGASVSGGGIYVSNSEATITDCIVASNKMTGSYYTGAGGIACYDAPLRITNCQVLTNDSDGIACDASLPQKATLLRENEIDSNKGCGIRIGSPGSPFPTCIVVDSIVRGNDLSGIVDFGSATVILRNQFTVNKGDRGAGIHCLGSDSTIMNNRFQGNRATDAGGALCIDAATVVAANNTFLYNRADRGGGIWCGSGAQATVSNTLLWENSAPTGAQLGVGEPAGPAMLDIDHSDVQGGLSGVALDPGSTLNWNAGMIDLDPLIQIPANFDNRLTFGSPCRDAGFNHSYLPATDMEGDPRTAFGTADIGADEYFYHLSSYSRPLPGASLTLTVVGIPGQRVQIARGSGIRNPSLPTPHGPLHLASPILKTWTFGPIPAEGFVKVYGYVPAAAVPGDRSYFQALAGGWGGPAARLTNLLEIVVE